MNRIVVAALLAVGISGEARAQAQWISGNQLLEFCRQDAGTFRYGICMGYITAVAEALGRNSIRGFRACIPEGVIFGLVQEAVVQSLQRNSQERRYAAIGLVANALSEAFPCR